MRIKGQKSISKHFADKETAEIWGKYKEMILKEAIDFGAKSDDMYTVMDVLIAKYGEEGREFKETVDYFQDILFTYLGHLSYKNLLDHAKMLLDTPVYRGGQGGKNGKVSGTKKLPEPMTVLRKYAYLSSAINHLVKKGVPLDNNAIKVVAWLRDLDKKKKQKEEAKR